MPVPLGLTYPDWSLTSTLALYVAEVHQPHQIPRETLVTVVTGVRTHTVVCDTVVCMPQVDRFSVTMPPELGEGVRRAAARQGTSVSTWLTEAAADKLRNELLGAALDQWEAEDGPFTQAELDEAASRLGLAPRSDVA
jgi:hypothetical protein